MKIKKLKNITPKIRVPRTLSPKSWKHEASGTQGNVTLFGVNIFSCGWKLTEKQPGCNIQTTDMTLSFQFILWTSTEGRKNLLPVR